MTDTQKNHRRVEALLDHSDWLRALARRLVADPAAADDAVQDTYVVALDSAPRGLDERSGRAWLAGVLRNLVRMQRRGNGRRASRHAVAARPEALPSTADVLAEVDLKQRLAEHVVRLPEPLRTTVLLRYHEGLSSAEIARAQGLASGTVRWRLKRGLDLLREELDAHHGSREAWLGGLAAFARVPTASEASTAAPLAPLPPATGAVVGSVTALAAAVLLAVVALRPDAPTGTRAVEVEGLAPANAEAVVAAAEPGTREVAGDLERAPVSADAAHVEVLVVDAVGAPVAGVRAVSLGAATTLDATSDAQGRLRFSAGVDLGEEWLLLAPGSLPARRSLTPVDAGPDPADGAAARLVLPRGVALTGRLVDASGHALADRRLELDVDRLVPGFADRVPPELVEIVGHGRRASTTTAADGSFRFERLPLDWSGDLWVDADLALVRPAPNARDGRSLHLSRAEAGLHLVAEAVRRVGGRVVGPGGAPVEGVAARVWIAGRVAPLELVTRRDGRFSRRLARGEDGEVVVEVEGEVRRFASLPEGGRLGDFVVDRPASEQRAATVDLEVLDASGRPLQGVHVADLAVTDGEGEATVPADGGALELHDVTGVVFARIERPHGPDRATVHAPEAVAPLTLLAQDDEGAPIVGTVFTLERSASKRPIHSRAWLDGRTTFGAVLRGGAELHVVARKHGFVPRRVRLADLESHGRDDVDAALVLQPGHSLTVQVLDAAGEPVDVDALRAPDVCGLEREATRLHPGAYTLDDLPRGPVELLVLRKGDTRTFTASVEDGAAVTLTW